MNSVQLYCLKLLWEKISSRKEEERWKTIIS